MDKSKESDQLLKKQYVRKLRQQLHERMISFPNDITEIFDFLFLGGEYEAMNLPLLARHGITHIINCAASYTSTGKQFYGNAVKGYTEFDAEDEEDYNILQHFSAVYDVIEQARTSGGRVFIHCLMGVNRSAALVVAYTMLHQKCGPITAAMYVLNRRKHILSNEAFQEQLVNFAEDHHLLELDANQLKCDK